MLTCHLIDLCLHPAAHPQSPTAKCLDPVSIPSRGRTLSARVFSKIAPPICKRALSKPIAQSRVLLVSNRFSRTIRERTPMYL